MVAARSRPVSKPDPVVLRDPQAIKALAHPARLAVIDEFFAGRKLTATEAAEIAGLSASAMSYHLRALEKWGIIRRSETTGDGRQRPWEAVGDRLMIDSAEPRASAAGEAVLVGRMLDQLRSDTLGWLADGHKSSDWYEATAIGSFNGWLTRDEAKQLGERLGELVAEYEHRPADVEAKKASGARRVRVTFSVVPIPGD